MKNIIFIILFCLFILGCSSSKFYNLSAISYYEDGIYIARYSELPSSEEVSEAIEYFDKAIDLAKDELNSKSYNYCPSYHDQLAYIIPLSRLGKAELYARFNKISPQEEECWKAIKESEEFLGQHINKNPNSTFIFGDYSVFFRREKIRRYAFSLLKESYRKAGERDLENLMDIQIAISSAYLNSKVAHDEERYIRDIEIADWVKRYKIKKENIDHGVLMFLLVLSYTANQMSLEMRKEELENAYEQAQTYEEKQRIRQEIENIEAQMRRNKIEFERTIKRMEKIHRRRLRYIESEYTTQVMQSMMANFDMLNLSPEIKRLASYQKLIDKKRELDNYIERKGFDLNAARSFTELRTYLDELVLEVQEKMKRKREM